MKTASEWLKQLVELLQKLPPATVAMLILAALILLFLVASIPLTVGVLMGRQVEIFPPKIYSPQTPLGENTSKAIIEKDDPNTIKIIKSIISGIDVPILVYRRQGSSIYVIAANKAAADFYDVNDDQLNEKTPHQLHTLIKEYVSNYRDWTAEQTDRTAETIKNPDKDLGKTKVPMDLRESHPLRASNSSYASKWYITSKPVKIGDMSLLISRFSSNATVP